jgi:hypothetical protein
MASQPNDDSSQPLLSSDTIVDGADLGVNQQPANSGEVDRKYPRGFKAQYTHSRSWVQGFLSSRAQHFCVLTLVSLDLLGIFADIFINLYTCEEGNPSPKWDAVRNVLGIAGLVFSCLFMLELILSVWAFGWRLDGPFSDTLFPSALHNIVPQILCQVASDIVLLSNKIA